MGGKERPGGGAHRSGVQPACPDGARPVSPAMLSTHTQDGHGTGPGFLSSPSTRHLGCQECSQPNRTHGPSMSTNADDALGGTPIRNKMSGSPCATARGKAESATDDATPGAPLVTGLSRSRWGDTETRAEHRCMCLAGLRPHPGTTPPSLPLHSGAARSPEGAMSPDTPAFPQRTGKQAQGSPHLRKVQGSLWGAWSEEDPKVRPQSVGEGWLCRARHPPPSWRLRLNPDQSLWAGLELTRWPPPVVVVGEGHRVGGCHCV